MLSDSQRYVRECQGKKAFPSQAKARRFELETRSAFGGEKLVPYECTWCTAWHLGHANKWRERVAR